MPEILNAIAEFFGAFSDAARQSAEAVVTGVTGADPAPLEHVRITMVVGFAMILLGLLSVLLRFGPDGSRRRDRAARAEGQAAAKSGGGAKRPPKVSATAKTAKRKAAKKPAKKPAKKTGRKSKRKAAKRKAAPALPDAALTAIEGEMRDMKKRFEAGEISREDYIAGSRTLYERARDIEGG